MKIRMGFVSNSSSSSFIVLFKDSTPCPHCGRSDLDFINTFVKNKDDGETSLEASGSDSVIEYLEKELKEIERDEKKYNYEDERKKDVIEAIQKLRSLSDKDKGSVFYFSISTNDEVAMGVLESRFVDRSAVRIIPPYR